MVYPKPDSEESLVNGVTSERVIPRPRTYPESPPRMSYEVYIEALKGKRFPIASLSKHIRTKYPKEVDIFFVRKNKLRITTSNRLIANNIALDVDYIRQYNTYIPSNLVEIKSIIPLPTDYSEEDIYKELRVYHKVGVPNLLLREPQVVEARRLQRKEQDTIVDMELVCVTFTGTQLPSHITLDNVIYPVFDNKPPILQCKNCWRYGHTLFNCRSKPRCVNCGIEKSEIHDSPCSIPTKCVNCGRSHCANDRSCPEYVKNKQNRDKNFKNNPRHSRTTTAMSNTPLFSPEDFPPLNPKRIRSKPSPTPSLTPDVPTYQATSPFPILNGPPVTDTTPKSHPLQPLPATKRTFNPNPHFSPEASSKILPSQNTEVPTRKSFKFTNPIELCIDIIKSNVHSKHYTITNSDIETLIPKLRLILDKITENNSSKENGPPTSNIVTEGDSEMNI